MNAQQIGLAMRLVHKAIVSNQIDEAETLAWQTYHALSDISKLTRAAEALGNPPRVCLMMVRARGLKSGDVVVGRVGGTWRIVESVEFHPAGERITSREGHISIYWSIEHGEYWTRRHDRVCSDHYFFVVKKG